MGKKAERKMPGTMGLLSSLSENIKELESERDIKNLPEKSREMIFGEKERSKEEESESESESEEMDTIETKLELEETDDDFYKELAKKINAKKTVRDKIDKTETKKEHFEKQIDAVVPALKEVLNEELEQNQRETVEKILGMLIALQSLRKNQSRYTQNHLNYRLNEVLKMVVNDESKEELRKALENIVKDNVYNTSKGKNSVPFDVRETQRHFSKPEEAKIKRVKIEHEEAGKVVYGGFTYDRKALFNEENAIIPNDKKYEDFRDQIVDFVNVAIHEYGKGTQEKPIVIIFKETEQPEAALALLLEYKKRAVMEGKEFYARHDGKKVVITTDKDKLTQDEINYFLDYANKKPEICNKGGKKEFAKNCAGYSFLANEGLSTNEDEKKAITQERLKNLLDKMIKKEEELRKTTQATSSPAATKARHF